MPRHKGYPTYKRKVNRKFRRKAMKLIRKALMFSDFEIVEIDQRTRNAGKFEFWS